MAELGNTARRYHREIGELARQLGITVIGVGEPARDYGPILSAPDVEGTVEAVRAFLEPGDAVLVKASRAVGLEGIPEEIAKIAGAWSQS